MNIPISTSSRQVNLPLTLEKLTSGDTATVLAINVEDELKKRFFALGLKEGAHIQLLRKARLGGPMHLRVGTSELILRLKEASCICLLTSVVESV
jgi:ferrous iron transport protein A